MRLFSAAIVGLVVLASWPARGAEPTPSRGAQGSATANRSTTADPMKIRIRIGDTTVDATLLDSGAAREFASLLPLTLKLNDLFGREKYGRLPRAISGEGTRTRAYEVGDVAYWSPGPDVAIYYRQDRQSIPSPGIVVLARVDSGIEALDVPGAVQVTIERVE